MEILELKMDLQFYHIIVKLILIFCLQENLTKPFIDFNINFNSQNTNKILRRFNIYEKFNKETSLSFQGKIDVEKKNKI